MDMFSVLRRSAMILTAASFLLSGVGCRSRIEVDGEYYAMLDEREERELVMLARDTLVRSAGKIISKEEADEVRRREPELKIDYRGDCFGDAVVSWDLKNIKLEVVYEGKLNESDPRRRGLFVRTMKKYPPVLDMRKERLRGKAPAPRKP